MNINRCWYVELLSAVCQSSKGHSYEIILHRKRRCCLISARALLAFRCPGPALSRRQPWPWVCTQVHAPSLGPCLTYTAAMPVPHWSAPNSSLPTWLPGLTSGLSHRYGLGGNLGCLLTPITSPDTLGSSCPGAVGPCLRQGGPCLCLPCHLPWLPAHRPSWSSPLLLLPENCCICHWILRLQQAISVVFTFSIPILLFVAFELLANFYLVCVHCF